MNRHIVISLLIYISFMSLSTLSHAKIYKWVDSEGNTHYTQAPPGKGIEAESIRPSSSPSSSRAQEQLENRQKLLQGLRERRVEGLKERDKKRDEMDRQAKNCGKAGARLASYQRPRVNLVDGDGNVTRASEEQRQQEIKKSRELVKELCK